MASYLTHHGYVDTAESFLSQLREERIERATGLNGAPVAAAAAAAAMTGASSSTSALASESTTNSSALRAEIRAAALSGTASGAQRALDLVEQHFPSLLDPSSSPPATSKGEGALTATEEGKSIGLRLRCRVFVEAVLEWSRANRDPAGMAELAMEEGAAASAVPPSTAAGTAGHGDVADEDADMLSASTVLDNGAARAAASSSSSTAPPLTLDSILSLGQSLHATYSSDPDPRVREELQAVLGMMAYRDPEKEATGRTSELLSKGERENVADELNKAILRKLAFFLFRTRSHPSRFSSRPGSLPPSLVDQSSCLLQCGKKP